MPTSHGHLDHIAALDLVQARFDLPFHLHPANKVIAGREPDEPLAHGQEIAVGELNLHVLHTPGHTPGSVCSVVESGVFSRDTWFPGGPGATRWGYSRFGPIMDAIEQLLMTLRDGTIVYPGHGQGTTIGKRRPQVGVWRSRGR